MTATSIRRSISKTAQAGRISRHHRSITVKQFVLKDPKKRARFLEALSIGATIEMACNAAGIGLSTYYNVQQAVTDGRRYNGKKVQKWEVELVDEVHKAIDSGNVNALAHIRRAMPKNWQAAAWLLERRLPNKFGRPYRMPENEAVDDARVAAKRISDALRAINASVPPDEASQLEGARSSVDIDDDDEE